MAFSEYDVFFFFNETATTEMYTRSLHGALPIWMVLYTRKRSASTLFCVCALLGSTGWSVAQMGPPISADKKLIGFACNTVEPSYLREHVTDLEQLPLDGLNIFVYPDDWGPKRTGQEGMFFGGRRFTRADFGKALGDLKATRFQRFPANFIQVDPNSHR